MNNHPPEEATPRRVAILRALPGLGDWLCAVPAFRALRAALPEAHITLIGLPGARNFVARFSHYLDDLLEFPGYPGLPERTPSIRQLPDFFAGVQQHRFDLALQLHGSGIITNPFLMLLGARRNAGFYLPGQYCPDEELFLPYPSDAPEVWRLLRLLEFLGIPLYGDTLEFPLGEEDEEALSALPEVRDLAPGGYVCIHPGAGQPARRWPAEQFAAVADALAERGFRVVLTGTADEAGLTQAVAAKSARRPIDMAGRTSLGALGVLLSRARLVVCNDTGVSHLAAALRVPSVVIFTRTFLSGPTPGRWAPLDRELHRVVSPHFEVDETRFTHLAAAQRCLGDGCSAFQRVIGEPSDLNIPTQAVMRQVEDLLSKEHVRLA